MGVASQSASPSISIALTTFNGAAYLSEQLSSLIGQTYKPLEIVIGDDGSTDRTIHIIDEFTTSQPIPIRLIRNRANLGYANNFMMVAQHCRGELISFCDQDDVWRSDKLERMVEIFERSAATMMVHHNADLIDRNGLALGRCLRPRGAPSMESVRLSTSPWKYPLGFTQTFRRELLDLSAARNATLNPYKLSIPLAHDQWIPLVANVVGSTYYCNEALAQYRQHGANQFGAGEEVGLLARLGRKLARYCDYESYALVADAVRGGLADAAGGSPARQRAELLQGVHRYREISEAYAQRGRVYRAKSLSSRAVEWWKLFAGGRYRAGADLWFGYWAGARDLLLGVLLGAGRRPPSRFFSDFEDTLCMRGVRPMCLTADLRGGGVE